MSHPKTYLPTNRSGVPPSALTTMLGSPPSTPRSLLPESRGVISTDPRTLTLFSGGSNPVVHYGSPHQGASPGSPTWGHSSFLPENQIELGPASPISGHCSRPARGPPRPPNPTHGGHWSQASRPLLRSPRSALDLGNVCIHQTPLAWQRVRQDVGRTSPASRKTTGHCPQFPPNLGIVPGSSNGLGVAPGHWRLPPGSRSPSAASTARRRALAFCLGSWSARGRSLQPRGELPRRLRVPVVLPACTGRGPAGDGARLGRPPGRPAQGAVAPRGLAAGLPRSLGPGVPKPAPLSFVLKDRDCGDSALAVPKQGGPGAGSQGRRGEAHPARAAQRGASSRRAEDSRRRARSAGEVIDGRVRGEPRAGFCRQPLTHGEARAAGAPGRGGRRGAGVLCVVLTLGKSHIEFLHRSNSPGDGFPRPPNYRGGPRG